jgi:SAM-dependent methyltransferase
MNKLDERPIEPERRESARWTGAEAYERYMGGWSRGAAGGFLVWLDPSAHLCWLDVGCGTGALTSEILALEPAAPSSVCGVDASSGFVEHARASIADSRVRFETAAAEDLPFEDSAFDVVVSGLLLNFVREPSCAVREMTRVSRPGGVVGSYVWDYAGEMQPLRHFWEAVFAVVPSATELDEVRRFALCKPEPLRALFVDAGLQDVEVQAIDSRVTFRDFEDYWWPFLAGQGAAPSYLMSLAERDRLAVEHLLRDRLPRNAEGSMELLTRAWAVRGRA